MIANTIAKENIDAVRKALRALGLVVAEVDAELRYVWIENPHPDFDARDVIGKRDDELLPPEAAAGIIAFKREVLASGAPATRVLEFNRSDGRRRYNISAVPIVDASGKATGLVTAAVDVTAADRRIRS
jgi:PAS domain-containing protein